MEKVLKYIQDNYKLENGYSIIRCIHCIGPLLSELNLLDLSYSERESVLVSFITKINADYRKAADYKLSVDTHSTLKCGNDCIYYDESEVACPFSFWESNPSLLKIILAAFDNYDDISYV